MVKHLIRSTQDAGIVQDTLAGEAGEGEEETTGGYFYCSGPFFST